MSSNIQPGQINVIKRNGNVVPYDTSRIATAIKKAFLDPKVMGTQAAQSTSVVEKSNSMAQLITETFKRRMPSGGHINIEEIQDQVELTLMRQGEHAAAREYVIYRTERAKLREAAAELAGSKPQINVTHEDGSVKPLEIEAITLAVQKACDGIKDVDPTKIIQGTLDNLYDGIKEGDLKHALIMSARALIETDPGYSPVTARILLAHCRRDVAMTLGLNQKASYGDIFKSGIQRGIEAELLDERLGQLFDLDSLANAISEERDNQFQYLGLQILQDRYFQHIDEARIELPQSFFMRVAMGLALNEAERNERTIEFYYLLSSFDYMT